ncbi:MAG: MBL fold metallo-hydrolase RNA specificity domain-containing protein [Ilumatobacteraceae bacterium]
MATGGRVVHHLEKFLPDPANTVALVGFQAAGTRGRQLVEGAESVKIHGRYVPVRAEICDLGGFSVHADGSELIDWLGTATRPPSGVFVVHGEERASLALRRRIAEELGWNAVVPRDGERLDLHPAGRPVTPATTRPPVDRPAGTIVAGSDAGRARLLLADHGVLSSVDPDRGVHAVPVCYALVDDLLVVPVDTAKPKRSTALRRSANTAADPRASLLVEHWDRHDWQQLWWARADLSRVPTDTVDGETLGRLASALRDRYVQYRAARFVELLVFRVERITTWSGSS